MRQLERLDIKQADLNTTLVKVQWGGKSTEEIYAENLNTTLVKVQLGYRYLKRWSDKI